MKLFVTFSFHTIDDFLTSFPNLERNSHKFLEKTVYVFLTFEIS
jgi:hypothetical protein